MGAYAVLSFSASDYPSLVAVIVLHAEFHEKLMKLKYFIRKYYVTRQAVYV
jgi:hypothetical protein